MLTLLRQRCLLPSFRVTQVRSLQTTPRDVPSYIQRWDPTLQVSVRPREVLNEATKSAKIEPNPDQWRPEQAALSNDQHVVSAPQTVGSGRRRANRRLTHLLRVANTPAAYFDTAFPALMRKDYATAKACDPRFIWRLSGHDWDILWKTQAREWPIRRKGVTHLYQLSCDMLAVGRSVTPRHWAQYLEMLFLSGEGDKALSAWEANYKAPYDGAHLEVGAKLHALAGNVDRAQEISKELFKIKHNWNTSVGMTVFRAHTSSKLAGHHDYAKELYVRMKERKGKLASTDDYDAWLLGFLEAQNLGYATQVFKDMVRDGYLATTGIADNVNEVLRRLHMLYRLGTDIPKMTSIALDAMSVLPREYHGHLFGDWIKSTNVARDPMAAAQILDIMFKRGYTPEAYHFNVLIRALLRTGDKANILKAENLGWNMIEQARPTNSLHRLPGTIAKIMDKRLTQPSTSPDADTGRKFPPASTSTFALIMQHHAKAGQWEHVEYLARRVDEASLPLNVTVMNILMDNKCRQGAYASAWEIYASLTNPQKGSKGIFPDGATFRMLWKTLRLSLGDYATRDDPRMPSPRKLLKEMVTWNSLIHSRYDVEQFRQGLAGRDRGAIMKLVMHCFSYTQDLPGSLVALHVLYDKFNIRPTSKAAEILQKQMAWVDLKGESRAVHSQFHFSRSNRANIARIVRMYDDLVQQRIERLIEAGVNYDILTIEERGDIGLDLLSEFVRVVMKRSYPPEQVEGMIQEAKEFIGLPLLPTGDMDAFEVA